MPSDAVTQYDHDKLLDRLHAMEARTRALEEQLDSAECLAALGALAAGLAHQFNNIMTPLLGLARLALDNPTDAALVQTALETACATADRTGRLTDAVLNLAGESLSTSLRQTDHRAGVAQAIEESLACVVRDPARDNITVSVEANENLIARISPPALRQVLLNLLLNALQAMRATGGSLHICAELCSTGNSQPRSGDESPVSMHAHRTVSASNNQPVGSMGDCGAARVAITISDTGPGVPACILPHIFEPFVAANALHDGDSVRPHAGLGLAICKRLVEAANGDMTIDNLRERGACFMIKLPAA